MAEALAVRSALCTACELGYQDILLLSDCQVLMKTISSKTNLVEIHGILLDIYVYVQNLNSFSCRFIQRKAIVVADSLAKEVLALYFRQFH
ncbi:putative ribonuclease H domain-containing protein [Arabidopsis thaliana]